MTARGALILTVLLAAPRTPVVGQDSLPADGSRPTVRGYLEHRTSVALRRGRWTLLDYDRLRGDLSARAGRGVRAEAAVVWQLYRGDVRLPYRDVLPEAYSTAADTFSATVADRHFVNHAYLALDAGPVEVTAGKQYLTWGAAWVFNPTELFRPKDIIEPSYEREGVGALSARLALGPLSDVRIAFVPEGRLRTGGRVLRLRHHAAGTDLSAIAAEVWERAAPAAPGGAPGGLVRKRVVGGDASGELLGLGLWAEAAWSERAGERWLEATVGGNATLGAATLVVVEGHFDGRGGRDSPYALGEWLSRLAGERRTLGRRTVYAAVSRRFADVWQAGLACLGNPGDGSAVLVPSVSWAFAENVELTALGYVAAGPDGTEYGGGAGGAFVRGRVYF